MQRANYSSYSRQPPAQAQQQAQNQQVQKLALVLQLTSICWENCIAHKDTPKFSVSEKNCMHNCVQRYLDASNLSTKKILKAVSSENER